MASARQQHIMFTDDTSLMYIQNEGENKEEDSSHDSVYSDPVLGKSKRKSFVKKFRREWMDEPVFAGWLKPLPNAPEKCYCSLCDVVLLAGHSELEKHAAGRKHYTYAMEAKLNIHKDNENLSEKNADLRLNEGSSDITIKDDLLSNAVYQPIPFDVQKDGTLVRTSVKSPKVQVQPRVLKLVSNPKSQKSSTTFVRKTKDTFKRKLETTPIPRQVKKMNLPDRPDAAKLIRLFKNDTDTDEDFEYDEDDDLDDPLNGSHDLLREIRAELAYDEKKLISDKQKKSQSHDDGESVNGKVRDVDEAYRQVAEKELEARLNMMEEKRRHQLNIYKLRLLEMESRVKLAEAEVVRAEELHQLRITHLHLQIQREQNGYIVSSSDIQPDAEPDVGHPI